MKYPAPIFLPGTMQQQVSLVLHPSFEAENATCIGEHIKNMQPWFMSYFKFLIKKKKKVLITISRNLKHSEVRMQKPEGSLST